MMRRILLGLLLGLVAQAADVAIRVKSVEINGRFLFVKFEIENPLKTGITGVVFRVVMKCPNGKSETAQFTYRQIIEPGESIQVEQGLDPACPDGTIPISRVDVALQTFEKVMTDKMKWEEEVGKEPKSIQALIRLKKVKIGMSPHQVRLSWGEPKTLNKTITRAGTTEQWVYGSGNYLYFRGGRLDSMQVSR